MFLQIDATFWVQLVNFAIFFLIVRVVFLNPVGAAIRKRRAYIDGVQADYKEYGEEARALRAQAEAHRATARREAEERVTRARAEGERVAQGIGGDYGTRASAIAEDARKTVDGEIAAARAREPELAEGLARTLLERAVGALGG